MTERLNQKISGISYRGLPLFGNGSNPQNTSEFIALAGTVFLWLFVLLFLIFARPFSKKEEFKTVQIVLSSTPVAKTEKKESAAASPASQMAASADNKPERQEAKTVRENPPPQKAAQKATDAPKVTEKPAAKAAQKTTDVPKVAEKPAAKAAPKPTEMAPAKPAQKASDAKKSPTQAKTPAPSAPVEYARSVEDLMAEQMSARKSSSKAFDWDNFSDDGDDSSAIVSQPQKVSAASTSSGSSAKASEATDTGLVSQAEKDGSVNEKASESVTGTLRGIREAKYTGNAGSSHSSELRANVSAGSGNNQFAMTDGSSRGLIEPADPRIDLSEAAANLIDSTINVTIFIEVPPSGNVSGVDFNPSSILPPLVQSEIRAQIVGKWRFEQASYASMGKFQYTIKKL